MKILIKTCIIYLFLFSFYSFSQNTTQSEYQYIKNGISAQINAGLDIYKAGYTLQNLGKIKIGSHSFTFRTLYRDDKSIAGFWVQASSMNSTYTSCLPLDTPDLKQQYFEDINAWDVGLQRSYMQALSVVFSSKFAELQSTNTLLRERLYGE